MSTPIGIGIDGCRGGWLVAELLGDGVWRLRVEKSFAGAVENLALPTVALVDMPVGLPFRDIPRRECDTEARQLLGSEAAPRVFNAPARAALPCEDYQEALEVNRAEVGVGLSRQSFNLISKVRELDDWLANGGEKADRVLEAHPELAFHIYSRGATLPPKRTIGGQSLRLDVLEKLFPGITEVFEKAAREIPASKAKSDDLIDAIVLALASVGPLQALGDTRDRDQRNFPMLIWMPNPA